MVYKVYPSRIKRNIKKEQKRGNVFYPIKTNDSSKIIKIIDKYLSIKDGYLISSKSHLGVLIDCEISLDRVVYINCVSPNEVRNEIYDLGVRQFIFGDFESFVEFYRTHKDIKVGFRLRISQFTDYYKGFVDCPLGMFKSEFEEAIEYCNKEGVSFGIQMYFTRDTVKFHKRMLQNLISYIRDLNILYDFINLGGLSDNFCEIKKYFSSINIEVGERLLHYAVSCNTKLLAKKGNTLFIDASVYNGMLDALIYNKKFSYYFGDISLDGIHCISLAHDSSARHTKRVVVCGNSCDSKDILGTYWMMEDEFNYLYAGMPIEIVNVGAYFDVFQMRYIDNVERQIEIIEED